MTGIIDGTGSVGAAAGQFIVGATQNAWGWQDGYLLIVAITASLVLIPLLYIFCNELAEIQEIRHKTRVTNVEKFVSNE